MTPERIARARQFCTQRGLAYPALDVAGEIADPPAWYAQARELLAKREES